jgi:hypothetical protein
MASDPAAGLRALVERVRATVDGDPGLLAVDARRAAFDLAAVATWVLAVAAAVDGSGLPSWTYYALVVAGVAGHSALTARAESIAQSRREPDGRA